MNRKFDWVIWLVMVLVAGAAFYVVYYLLAEIWKTLTVIGLLFAAFSATYGIVTAIVNYIKALKNNI